MLNSGMFSNSRIQSALGRFYEVKAQATNLLTEKGRLISEIERIERFLSKKDEVSSALNELQVKTQAKTKEVYEELLTTLIHEIKGYDEENHAFKLRTKIKSNKSWLDIEIENKQGKSRDVFLDKGESIENIASIGLRFITLSRLSNRRFLAFDEPDKNLNPKQIPNLAKTLHELSKKIGIQVLYISHHDHENFIGHAKIIELTRISDKDGSKISTEVISEPDGGDDFSEHDPGIRYIRLQNFKQHENTLISLSPYVTVITGNVDIGKSSIIHAIDAVNRNGGRDGLIRDDFNYCRVELGIEENHSVIWTYKASGSRRTEYNVIDGGGNCVQRSDSGSIEPEWLKDYLGMPAYREFEINICGKNNQSFILDGKISGHRRSEILSLGDESNQVMKMIKLHAQEIESSTKELNSLKKKLVDIKNKLESYRLIFSIEDSMLKINDSQQKIITGASVINDLRFLIREIAYLEEKRNSTSKAESIYIPEKPKIVDTDEMKSVAVQLSKYTSLSSSFEQLATLKQFEQLVLQDNSSLKEKCIKMLSLKSTTEAMGKLPQLIEGNINSESAKEVKSSEEEMMGLIKESENLKGEISNLYNEMRSIEDQKQRGMALIKKYCPLCERQG